MGNDVVNWDDYLQIASKSDTGLRRSNNQDNLSISMAGSPEQWSSHGHLFVVCDGMGGHAAGELASKLATDHLALLHTRHSEDGFHDRLRKVIEQTNLEIHRRGLANPEFRSMGTTCTCLLLTRQGAWVGHVGDSRVYRLRGNRLEQLSFDHSYAWEMKAAGIRDASADIFKNRIMRSLGPCPEVKVDIEGPFPLEPGDRFLLCSDGLTGPVEDRELAEILAALPPDEACQTLVNLANMRGGPDNITVMVIQCLRLYQGESATGGGLSDDPAPGPTLPMLAAWAGFGILTVAAVVSGLMADWWATIIPGLAALVALTLAIWLTVRHTGVSAAPVVTRGGKAPYANASSVPSSDMADRLQEIVLELIELAKREAWVLDWPEIDQQLEQIREAERNKQLKEVIVGFSRLMNRILELGRTR